MASFHDSSTLNLRYQVGSGTDIGGGRENQDESFVWINKDANLIVLGVLDGHGREVGKIAAQAGKQRIVQYLDTDFPYLLSNPTEFLIRAHELAHEHIRSTFQIELEKQGYQVQLTEEGYLMKRRTTADYWSCVHGGTSCSLVALVGNALYIANVGDSTAVLCSAHPVLQKQMVRFEADAAMIPIVGSSAPSNLEHGSAVTLPGGSLVRDSAVMDANQSPSTGSKVLVLSAEHSPESPYEFDRLRRYRPRDGDDSNPALFVVYDSPSHDKSHCQPVFDPSQGPLLQPSQRGSYYKNVRKEWASLVSTPLSAKFQDALAFTRSLGDLHLHTYGVTNLPEVHKVELAPVFQALTHYTDQEVNDDNSNSEQVSGPTPVQQIANATICVVVATDGVWDNWLYEDVARFVMDASCLNATATHAEGAQKVVTSFMIRNSQFSKKHFGTQADNATGIALYLSLAPNFCA